MCPNGWVHLPDVLQREPDSLGDCRAGAFEVGCGSAIDAIAATCGLQLGSNSVYLNKHSLLPLEAVESPRLFELLPQSSQSGRLVSLGPCIENRLSSAKV